MINVNRKIKKIARKRLGKFYVTLARIKKYFVAPKDVPVQCFIEMNNSCNLRCKMCNIDSMERKVGQLSFDDCVKAVDGAARMKTPMVRLHMYGEPLLYKRLPELVSYSKSQGIEVVHITSNGTLLNSQLSSALIDAGLDSIVFSVTGFSEEIYQEFQGYRSRYSLRDVENKIEEFIRIRNQRPNSPTEIGLQYIFNGENFDDCVMFNNKWARQVDYIRYTSLTKFDGDETKERLVRDIVPCKIETLAVLSNGEVTVCCTDFDGKLSLGNIKDHPLDSFWKNDRFNRIQSILNSCRYDKLPAICKACDRIIDTVQWGSDFDDVIMRAAFYSLISAINQDDREMVIVGDGRVARTLLQYERIQARVLAVIGKNQGQIKARPVNNYDALQQFSSPDVLIVNTGDYPISALEKHDNAGILDFESNLREYKTRAANLVSRENA